MESEEYEIKSKQASKKDRTLPPKMMASLIPAIVEATNSINNARACPLAPHKIYELHRPCTSLVFDFSSTAITNIIQLSESHKSFHYQIYIVLSHVLQSYGPDQLLVCEKGDL